jgi:hypothetical protein
MACLTAGISARAEVSLATPIERNYIVNDPGSGLLSILKNNLPLVTYDDLPGVSACDKGTSSAPRFTKAEFTDASDQLNVEFGYVGLARGFIANLKQPFSTSDGSAAQIAVAVDAVRNAVSVVPSATPARFNGLDLAVDLLDFASYIPFPTGFTGFGNAAGLLAESVATFGTLDAAPDGTTPALPPDVQTTADGLALDLSQQYANAADDFDGMGRILASDWGKLKTTAANADPSGGPWTFDDTALDRSRNALGLSAQSLAFETLFPLGYSIYNLDKKNQPGNVKYPADYQCTQYKTDTGNPYTYVVYYNPFKSVPSFGDVFPIVAAGPVQQIWAYGNKNSAFVEDAATNPTGGRAPTQDLVNQMFVNPSANLSSPPLNQLRFALETYAKPGPFHTVTTNNYQDSQTDETDVCQVD